MCKERTEFVRLCPSCGKEIFYKSQLGLSRALAYNKNGVCCPTEETRKKLSDLRSNGKMYNAGKKNIDIFGEEKAKDISNRHSKSISGENHFQQGKTNVEFYGEEKAKLLQLLRLNKKYEEIYGDERAAEIKKKQSESSSGENHPCFGKTYEEYFGEERAAEIKEKLSNSLSGENHPFFGKTYEEIYGEIRAECIINKLSGENHFLSGKSFDEYYGDERANQLRKKISESNSGENNYLFNKTFEDVFGLEKAFELKLGARLRRIKQIEQQINAGCSLHPNYSQMGCEYFDWIMEMTGTFIQHAMNIGEFHVKDLGYWVDGYDKENNIVYEFDERHHFNLDGTYKARDIRRQKEITDLLGCYFVRIVAF